MATNKQIAMTRQEYKQLSPEEQKQIKIDLLIAACCIVPSLILCIATAILA